MQDEFCQGADDTEKHLFVGGPLNFSWRTRHEYQNSKDVPLRWCNYYPKELKIPVCIDPDQKLEDRARVIRTVYVYGGTAVGYPLLQLVLNALERGPARVSGKP